MKGASETIVRRVERNKKELSKTKFKKAPWAPKRFKSSYMFYSEHQHKVLRQQNGHKKLRAADAAKMVSQSWKKLTDAERAKWMDMARVDRERFEKEKAAYKGPWKLPDVKLPYLAKKPMSAFLAFGNERRRAIAEANPLMSNAEISALLSKLWKDCPPDVKQAYRDREAHERETFKRQRAEWERKKDQSLAEAVMAGDSEGSSWNREGRTSPLSQWSQHSSDDEDISESNAQLPEPTSFNSLGADTQTMNATIKTSPFAQLDVERQVVADLNSWQQSVNAYHTPQNLQNFPSSGIFSMVSQFQTPINDQFWFPDFPESTPVDGQAGPFVNSSEVLQPRPLRSDASRFNVEDYSIEQLLEDEELFEDFSPEAVPNVTPQSQAALTFF